MSRMVVSGAVLILKMRTYPPSFAASLVTFDKALTPLNILWNFLHQGFGENSHLQCRTELIWLNFMYSTVSVVQTDRPNNGPSRQLHRASVRNRKMGHPFWV